MLPSKQWNIVNQENTHYQSWYICWYLIPMCYFLWLSQYKILVVSLKKETKFLSSNILPEPTWNQTVKCVYLTSPLYLLRTIFYHVWKYKNLTMSHFFCKRIENVFLSVLDINSEIEYALLNNRNHELCFFLFFFYKCLNDQANFQSLHKCERTFALPLQLNHAT